MAYKKSDLEKQALKAIEEHDLVFINEVVSHLPCSTATFYNFKLEDLESIKAALEQNRVGRKNQLRSKMFHSDNATAWIALYKLLGDDDEADRLNGSRQKLTLDGELNHNVRKFSEAAKKIYGSDSSEDKP